MVMLPGHLCKVVRSKIHLEIRWAKGNSGDVGNSMTDELADLGSRVEEKHLWWKRFQPMGNWDDIIFREQLENLEKGQAQNEKALCTRTRMNGDLNFPRGDIPSLDTLTKATVQSAMKWGFAKTTGSRNDVDRKNEIKRLNAERKREKDAVKTKH